MLALHALGLDFDHQNSHKSARHASTHFLMPELEWRATQSIPEAP